MSNKLITDTFPTVKKQKIIKQKPQSTKTKDKNAEVKRGMLELLVVQVFIKFITI